MKVARARNAKLGQPILILMLSAACNASWSNPILCERRIDLQPHQTATIATTVANDFGYTSQVVEVRGGVRTDDGFNRLQSAWLYILDAFRWGKNQDLQSKAGPLIEFNERVGSWGIGHAEIRVQASGSPTHLCVCTRDEGAAARAGSRPDLGYPKRVEACMSALRAHGFQ
jgi:hypothetical protein